MAVERVVYEITALCTSCDACLAVCPTSSIAIGKSRYVIDADTCDGHAVCARVCPVNAIQAVESAEPKPA